MDLLFHIGCEKTGTTSVQSWLHHQCDALAQRGIHYARSLGRPNNRRICFYGLEPGTPDDQLRRDGIHTAEDHAALQLRIAADLIEEVAAARSAGCTTFVISNEHCHSRLKTMTSVQRVHDLLAPLFARIQIHCFLRPQIDLCLSLASTLSRNGGTISRGWLDRELRANNQYYLFDDLLDRWSAVFGRDAITPVSFKRIPDTVAYFEQVLGVADAALPRRRPANTALDYRVMAIINGMNKADPGARDFEYVMRLFLNELPVEERLTIDRYSAQVFQARFQPANQAVCQSWPQIEFADLRPEWRDYPQDGNIDRMGIGEEVGPFVRRILDRMRLENACEKARRMAMTSEREWANGRIDAALRACRDGLGFAAQAAAVEMYRRPMELLIKRLEHRMRRIEADPTGKRPRPPSAITADDESDATPSAFG